MNIRNKRISDKILRNIYFGALLQMSDTAEEWKGGEVLFAGCTDHARAGGRAGGSKGKKSPAEMKV